MLLQPMSEARNKALVQPDMSGWTPLHYAAHSGVGYNSLVGEDVVKKCIDSKDMHQQTALMLAVAGAW